MDRKKIRSMALCAATKFMSGKAVSVTDVLKLAEKFEVWIETGQMPENRNYS